MFCMNCGAQLSDSAKFCTSCGAKQELPDHDNPVVSAAEQSSQAAVPQQTAAPAISAAPSFIPNEVNSNSSFGGFGSDFANRRGNREQQAQSAGFAQPMQQLDPSQSAEDIQPMRYSADILAVKPIKKKSKLIPGLCIAAGAAVVLGGAGAVFCQLNKPLVSKLIMGDAGYAHSITMNALSGVNENSAVIGSAVQQSMGAGLMAAQSSAELSEITAASDGAISDNYDSVGNSAEDFMGKALEMAAWQINHATGTRGVTSEAGVKAEFDSSIYSALREQGEFSPEQYGEIENILKNIDLSMRLSEKDSGSALEYAADIRAFGDCLAAAQLRYEEDGTATLIFPGMSSVGFSAKLPAHTMEENHAAFSFDFEKFFGNVSSGLKETFKNFEIKCENGTTELGTLKFTGMTVQIDLDRSDLCDIAMVVINAARSDSGLTEYLACLDDSMTVQDITESYDEIAKEIEEFRNSSETASARIVYCMNSDNTLAGAEITAFGSADTVQFRFLSVGNDCEMIACENDKTMFSAHVKGDTENSGTVTAMIADPENGESATFTIEYSELGRANVFGLPMTTGMFKLKFSEADTRAFLEDEMDLPEEIACAAGSSELSLTLSPKGKGAECRFVINAQNIGSLTYFVSVDEVSGEVAPKPGSEYKTMDINDISSEDIDDLGEDIIGYYNALSEKNPLVKAVYSFYDAVGSVNNGNQFSPNTVDDRSDYDDFGDYGDYDSLDWDSGEWEYNTRPTEEIAESEIIAANSNAQRMKQSCEAFLKEMEALNAAPDCGSAEILVYVWDNGSWQSYVSCYENSNFEGYADSCEWTDGKDHWGTVRLDENDEIIFEPDEKNLTDFISDLMPDVETGIFIVYIQDKNVLGAVYSDDHFAFAVPMAKDFGNGSWNFAGSGRAGVANGYVIGTAPTLALDESAE